MIPLSRQYNWAALASNSRIDNDNMNGTDRKISACLLDDDGCFDDVIRWDVMGNIDDLNIWSEAENNAFHRSNKGILQAEIRG